MIVVPVIAVITKSEKPIRLWADGNAKSFKILIECLLSPELWDAFGMKPAKSFGILVEGYPGGDRPGMTSYRLTNLGHLWDGLCLVFEILGEGYRGGVVDRASRPRIGCQEWGCLWDGGG